MARLSRRSVLVGLGATAACARPAPMTAVEPTRPPAGDIVTVDGVPIHFSRSGSGRPMCLLHGASGNLNDMTFRLGPRLAERFDVIAFDRPGHGSSGMPPGGGTSIGEQAALQRGAAAAIGAERPIVVGHSYGESVALAWSVAAPETVAALVLLATPSQVWEGGLGVTTDLLANGVTGPPLAWAAPRVVTRGFAEDTLEGVFAPQPVPDGYLDHLDLSLVLQPHSLRENARQLSALKDEIRPMVATYPALRMPVELVHGEADRTVGLDIHSVPFARQVPGATLTRLPGVGHMPHQVALTEVIAAIDRAAARAQ